MTEELLLRRGRPCGVVFCLHGPRLVRFSAIWVADEQAVYMYDSTGARYAKLLLEEGPPLPAQAA